MNLTVQFKRFTLAMAVAGALLASAAVEAKEIRYAMGYPPGADAAKAAERVYTKALKEYSNGELTAKVYPLSLLSFQEMAAGIRDGIADSGLIALPYHQAEFAHANLASELSMMLELLGGEPGLGAGAYSGAMAEFIFFKCPECIADFTRQKQVYTGSSASSEYHMLCTKPVTTLEAVRGSRLRVGGGNWSRWATELGAISVSLTANEIYESLSQKVVDCTINSTPELVGFRFAEVVTDITVGPPGGVIAHGVNNVNIDVWRSLTDKQRQALLRASARLGAEISWLYIQDGIRSLEAARNNPRITIHEPGEDLMAATRQFIARDLDTIAKNYRDKYRVKRSEELIADFREILKKWVQLIKGVNSSEELAELYWNEVFSKVDVSKYAM